MGTLKKLIFPYEDSRINCVQIPNKNLVGSYYIKEVPAITNLPKELEKVLDRPEGTLSFDEMMQNRSVSSLKLSIIVDDLSRPTPTAKILPILLTRLKALGVKKRNIVITIALGTHPPMTEKEKVEKVGEDVCRNYLVTNSHYDDYSKLTLVGRSDDGIPIYIDKHVVEADFRIGVGSIVPHGAVGWSGGGKILYPGVAGKETVTQFHFLHGITQKNMKGLENCPVRLTMEKWVDKIGLDFIVNCVLTQDGDVYKLTAGHYIHAQRLGVSYGKKIYSYPNEKKCDLVIAISYPHDIDFWQAAKGIYAGEQLTKDGGTLVLASPCFNGSGNHPLFLERCGRDSTIDELKGVLEGRIPEPEDSVSLAPASMVRQITKRINIIIVSPGLERPIVEKAGFSWSVDVQGTLDEYITSTPEASVATVHHCDVTFR